MATSHAMHDMLIADPLTYNAIQGNSERLPENHAISYRMA